MYSLIIRIVLLYLLTTFFTMNKRLEQFLGAENITQTQFAETLGVAKASVSHILAGRNKPGFEFIESLARKYPNLNLEWLISGRGRMYKDSPDASLISLLPDGSDNIPDENGSTGQQDVHITKVVVFFSDGTFREIV